ncbi:DiGeorge syndrome critical region gene 2 [Cricetulus griseus]
MAGGLLPRNETLHHRSLAWLKGELRCNPGQFACHSGAIQCIPLPWQCDGWATCEDKSDEADCPEVTGEAHPYHGKETLDLWQGRTRRGDPTHFHTVNMAQPVRFSRKCPTGWHHYEGTASCYRVYLNGENYWDAAQTCQRVNGSLATFSTDQELRFVLAQEWDQPERSFGWKDQRKLWVGYQYVITGRNHSLEGRWEVAFKGSSEVFLPPDPIFASAMSESDNVFCAQLQCFHFPTLRHHDLHSWHAESCSEKSSFLCKRSQTCVDIKDNVVDEGFYFTPKGDDPCLSCTCHRGEPEMCVAALCERPQGCQQYRKDPKECCKFMCLDTDGSSLFDSMASGMRLVVSCISSFLILSLLLFMVHRLRQRRRERIESLIGANLHHFNLGRRIPGFDYGPDGFGTGLTPLHLSDDGEGGTFHFHDPPPPYTAYKYPDMDQPDDPPPPYEASINPDSMFYDPADDDAFEPEEASLPTTRDGGMEGALPRHLEHPLPPAETSLADLEDSTDSSSALLVPPDPAQNGNTPATEAPPGPRLSVSTGYLSTPLVHRPMNDQPSKYPGHTFLVQSAVLQSHSHSCIMWALGFLLRFLAMQPVAKVDSKGPTHWKELAPACGGPAQSPVNIDLRLVQRDYTLEPFIFQGYDSAPLDPWTLENDGHTVLLRVNSCRQSCPVIRGAGLPSPGYRLLQLHFHWGSPGHKGSEHSLDEKRGSMEMHMLHVNTKYQSMREAQSHPDGFAVLAVLLVVAQFQTIPQTGSPSLHPRPIIDNFRPQQPLGGRRISASPGASIRSSVSTLPCLHVALWGLGVGLRLWQGP